MNLRHLLDRAAALAPDAVAAVDAGTAHTWRELDAATARLARALEHQGVGSGARVAILSRNRVEYLCAYFATAELGALLVPLNTRWTAHEIGAVLADCTPAVLLAEVRHAERVGAVESAPAMLWIDAATAPAGRPGDGLLGVFARDAARPARRTPPRGDTAQLYYTSGTTGRPKGVELSHANVLAHALSTIAELRLCERDVWAHIAPMFHLADAWATFALTAVGARHVFLRDFAPDSALGLLARERVTITNLVPTMLNLMVEHPSAKRDWPDLRALLSGGAPIAPEVVRRIVAVFGCEYVQTYGMTETSPYLTMSLLGEAELALPPEQRLQRSARTGRAVLGVELRVVDGAGAAVPCDDATVGEIEVRGPGVTRGYWNDPAATAAAFTPDGFLRTGDLATIDASGSVRIVDRKKDVIATGGEKVYSTEVEHRLHEHPAVLEVAVYGTPDPLWGERVTAAVVLRPGCAASGDDLAAFCRQTLAGYKVPRVVHFLEALPRTGSGKIQKQALRGR